MKKIIPILIVGIFLISGASVTALNNYNLDWNINSITTSSKGSDMLDQSQTEQDFFAPVGNIFLAPTINYITAQSFKPTLDVLTRVEILAGKNSTATHDLNLAIKDDLLGPDLTSLSLPTSAFVTENFSWVEFDFDDILVTPGNTYYIVSSTADITDNWYAWGVKLSDVYPDGSVWWSEDDGDTYEEDPDADLAFKTYGHENNPPGTPQIFGPDKGTVDIPYEFTFIVTDPEGDDVYLWIEWFAGCPGVFWQGPYESGEEVKITYTYEQQGDFTISATAKDIFDEEGPKGTHSISIPRARSINMPLFKFLEKYLCQFPLIKYLLGL